MSEVRAAIEDAHGLDPADIEGFQIALDAVGRALAGLDTSSLSEEEQRELSALMEQYSALQASLDVALSAVDPGGESEGMRLPFDADDQAGLHDAKLSALDATASTLLNAEDGICLGKTEKYDWFGDPLAVGDFNGDGYFDLAVAAPEDDDGLRSNVGFVYVYQGGPAGMEPWFRLSQSGLGANEQGDQFGHALAGGDIDADGYDDLAVGVPNEDLGSTENAGYVFVFRGGTDGLEPWLGLSQSGLGSNESGDDFGDAVVFGDFDGDGHADLAVGAPNEDAFGVVNAGYIFVFRGTTDGLSPWYGLHYRDIDVVTSQSRFGMNLAVGDFNGDGRDDLAAGAHGKNDYAGVVYVFMSRPPSVSLPVIGAVAADSFSTTVDFPALPPYRLRAFQRLDQTGLGANEAGDSFGDALAAGDLNGDGMDDLAVGAWSESTSSLSRDGYVFLFRFHSNFGNLQPWKGLPPDGIASRVSNSYFGSILAAGDLNDDGIDDLVVGRQLGSQESDLLIFQGTAGDPIPWSNLDQVGRIPRLPPDAAPGIGDFNGDGIGDLAVGAPGTGTVFTFLGHSGAAPSPWEELSQQAPGCIPTWPSPPTIDLVTTTDTQITIRIRGEEGTTHLLSFDEDFTVPSRLDEDDDVTRIFSGLDPDTEYCFHARALWDASDAWSDDAVRCFATEPAPPDGPEDPEEHTFSVWLNGQPLGGTGYRPYVGSWGPVSGAHLTGISVPNHSLEDLYVRFVKPGYTTDNCGDPASYVEIEDGHSATPDQIEEIFGTSTPSGEVWFVACVGVNPWREVDAVIINITYVYD